MKTDLGSHSPYPSPVRGCSPFGLACQKVGEGLRPELPTRHRITWRVKRRPGRVVAILVVDKYGHPAFRQGGASGLEGKTPPVRSREGRGAVRPMLQGQRPGTQPVLVTTLRCCR